MPILPTLPLLSWFNRKTIKPPPSEASAHGFHRPATASALLNTPRRQELLENIWRRASLSRQQFNTLYRQPLERYAELVQLLPASENHHHAHLGGLLDHGLEIVAYALKIRQSHLLPVGAPPESQSAQAEAWTAAAAYGALLHDLGKVAVDVRVELQGGQVWHPWHGPITRPYRFKYVKGREYQLHGAASALLYSQVLDANILDWLSGFPELWRLLIYLLAGRYEHAGVLGEIVTKADSASVAQELGGNPDRALTAPKQSLQRQLADGLRYLVREQLGLNNPAGPGDGWLTQEALWLMSKTVSEQLRALLVKQGVEGIPTSNTTFFNMLQDQAIIQTNAQDKAIWKVTVSNGKGWANTFTLLKVAPALIWPDPQDRPEPYVGTVQVVGGLSVEEAQQQDPESAVSASVGTGATTEMAPIHKPVMPGLEHAPHSAKVSNESNEIDELMALLANGSEPLSQAATEMIPIQAVNPTPQSAQPSEPMPPAQPPSKTELGQGFVNWLKDGLVSRRIILNDAKALVHTVTGTAMLVTPGIFKRFVQEFPTLEAQAKAQNLQAWELVQRSFEKLKLHRKTEKSLNIWTVKVVGPRSSKVLRGYLLNDPHTLFHEVPLDNPSLFLQESSQ